MKRFFKKNILICSLQEKKEDSSVSESDDDSEEECDSSADVSSLTSSDFNGQAGSTVPIIDPTNQEYGDS